jgi:ornithine decarboxylase
MTWIQLGYTVAMESYASVACLLEAEKPPRPVYCIYPEAYRQAARRLVSTFPGRVLYAVKANSEPQVLRLLHEGGIRHFDCASLAEIEAVRANCPDSRCYFMVPVTIRGETGAAFHEQGVRHFMLDHESGLQRLAGELPLSECVVFVRMAVSHESAMADLSSKFGAEPAQVPALMDAIAQAGAEPALAFNVGSLVTRTEAYAHALDTARQVLAQCSRAPRLLDIGGGFPHPYPDFEVPRLECYVETVRRHAESLPLARHAELMAEPGRALAAPGLSAVVEVLQRRDDRLYLNDGMYGIFWELRFKGHQRFAAQAWRGGRKLVGDTRPFWLFGPTCDSSDRLPAEVPLPVDIRQGDHLEFGRLGAYSLSGRTDFNGLHSDRLVLITGEGEWPPGE